jgi:hypothetical protein
MSPGGGNNEEIRVSLPVDKTQIDAANKALGELEKNSRKIEVVQRSANSMRQIAERLERQSAGFGLTGNERAIAMARLSIDRLKSDEVLYARGQKALEGMIEKQKALASQTELTTKANESFFGSFLKAGVALEVLNRFGSGLQAIIVHTAKYAAATEMYGTAARAIARANNISADSIGELEKRLISLGITTQESRRAISQAITAGIGTTALPQLARMAQDVAVLNPTTTSSDTLVRMLYAIQSAQPEMLRTVGVNVNFEKSYSTFAKASNRTIDSLSENEKAQIRLQNVLEKGARFAGTYETALGDVGKQMQTMDRFAKEASNAIGENFLPALRAVVSTSMWALDIINKHPLVAQAVGIGSAAGAGAVIGGGVGFMFGNLPGAVAGAKLGAVVGGTTGFVSTAARMEEENARLSAARQAAILSNYGATGINLAGRNADGTWRSRVTPITREQRIGGMLSAAYGFVPQEKGGVDTGSNEKQKRIDAERFKIMESIAQVRERELTGIAKINAEHQKTLRQLKEEKLDTAQLVGLAGDLRRAKLEAFVADNARRVKDMRMEVGGGITAGTISSELNLGGPLGTQDALGLATYERFLANQKRFDQIGLLGKAAGFAIEEQSEIEKATKKSIDEQERAYDVMFNRLRSGFESTFDSIIRNGANAAQLLRNLFLSALLTPIKQAASAMFANLMMPLMGGRAYGSGGGGVMGGGGGMAPFGSLASMSTSALGAASMIGPGGTAPFVGGTGGPGFGTFAGFGGMFSNAKGSLATLGNLGRGVRYDDAGFAYQGTNGVGGATGGAMLAGGGILAADGLRRGGWMGLAETTAGGALIGAKFGGWTGAAIGAGIGFTVGLIRMMFKGAADKARAKIKTYYGIDISDKGILSQIVGLAKQSYGGNLDVAVRAREIRDLIELYAMSTGQRMTALDNRPMGVNLSQMGGSLYQTGSYSNGVGYNYGGSIAPVAGLSRFTTPTAAPIVLDSEGTKAFWSDVMATGIVQNPRAVQAASLSAQSQNYGRTSAAVNLTDPLGATI